MKFSKFSYERPNYESVKQQMENLVKDIEISETAKQQLEVITEINQIRNQIETMATLASIRHSINTQDEFYDQEREYWDEYSPLYEDLNSIFYEALVSSKFRNELE